MSTLAAGMALRYNSRTKVGKTQRKVGKFLKKLLKPGANTVDGSEIRPASWAW